MGNHESFHISSAQALILILSFCMPTAHSLNAMSPMNNVKSVLSYTYPTTSDYVDSSFIGDVNGDGYPDALACNAIVGGGNGYASILFLNSTNANLAAKISGGSGGFTRTTALTSQWWGFSCSGGKDINGDGIPDIVVGALGNTNAASYGFVDVILLNRDGTALASQRLDRTVITSILGASGFGTGVSMSDDINSDGIPDLFVGAGQDDTGGSNAGAAFLIYLDTGGSSKSFIKYTRSTAAGTVTLGSYISAGYNFGWRIGAGVDLNNDGVIDVAGSATPSPGAIIVLFLGTSGQTVRSAMTIGASNVGFGLGNAIGNALVLSADVNGDGGPEIFTGGQFGDGGANNAGAVWIFSLTPQGQYRSYSIMDALRGNMQSFVPAVANAQFGAGMGFGADFNLDNYPDMIVSAKGTNKVYVLGMTVPVTTTTSGTTTTTRTTTPTTTTTTRTTTSASTTSTTPTTTTTTRTTTSASTTPSSTTATSTSASTASTAATASTAPTTPTSSTSPTTPTSSTSAASSGVASSIVATTPTSATSPTTTPTSATSPTITPSSSTAPSAASSIARASTEPTTSTSRLTTSTLATTPTSVATTRSTTSSTVATTSSTVATTPSTVATTPTSTLSTLATTAALTSSLSTARTTLMTPITSPRLSSRTSTSITTIPLTTTPKSVDVFEVVRPFSTMKTGDVKQVRAEFPVVPREALILNVAAPSTVVASFSTTVSTGTGRRSTVTIFSQVTNGIVWMNVPVIAGTSVIPYNITATQGGGTVILTHKLLALDGVTLKRGYPAPKDDVFCVFPPGVPMMNSLPLSLFVDTSKLFVISLSTPVTNGAATITATLSGDTRARLSSPTFELASGMDTAKFGLVAGSVPGKLTITCVSTGSVVLPSLTAVIDISPKGTISSNLPPVLLASSRVALSIRFSSPVPASLLLVVVPVVSGASVSPSTRNLFPGDSSATFVLTTNDDTDSVSVGVNLLGSASSAFLTDFNVTVPVQKSLLNQKLADDAARIINAVVIATLTTSISLSVFSTIISALSFSPAAAVFASSGGAFQLLNQVQFMAFTGNLVDDKNPPFTVYASFAKKLAWTNFQFPAPWGSNSTGKKSSAGGRRLLQADGDGSELLEGADGDIDVPIEEEPEDCSVEGQISKYLLWNIVIAAVVLVTAIILRFFLVLIIRAVVMWRRRRAARKKLLKREAALVISTAEDVTETSHMYPAPGPASLSPAAPSPPAYTPTPPDSKSPSDPWAKTVQREPSVEAPIQKAAAVEIEPFQTPFQLLSPRWEITVLLAVYLGLCESAGKAIRSSCNSWVVGGAFVFILFPAILFLTASFFVFLRITTPQTSVADYENFTLPRTFISDFRAATGLTRFKSFKAKFSVVWEAIKKLRFSGDWEAKEETEMKKTFVTKVDPFIGDFRRFGHFYFACDLIKKISAGIALAIVDEADQARFIFTIYLLDCVILLVLRPFRKRSANIVEAITAFGQVAALVALVLVAGDQVSAAVSAFIMFIANLIALANEVLDQVGSYFEPIAAGFEFVADKMDAICVCGDGPGIDLPTEDMDVGETMGAAEETANAAGEDVWENIAEGGGGEEAFEAMGDDPGFSDENLFLGHSVIDDGDTGDGTQRHAQQTQEGSTTEVGVGVGVAALGMHEGMRAWDYNEQGRSLNRRKYPPSLLSPTERSSKPILIANSTENFSWRGDPYQRQWDYSYSPSATPAADPHQRPWVEMEEVTSSDFFFYFNPDGSLTDAQYEWEYPRTVVSNMKK